MIKKVINIVKKASRIMLKNQAHLIVNQKGSCANIVTESDIQVQKYLYQHLNGLIENAGFLGEEELEKKGKEYNWIIDPIDGTTNYARNLNFSAISVALSQNDQVILGVVYNPFTKDLFYALKGKGAYHNGKKIVVSSAKFESSLFCTAMSLYKKELADICNNIICDVYQKCSDFRRLGSCALELCYLAAGKCDLYYEIRVFPWDYAAAGLVLEEAGGVLKTYPQKTLLYDQPVTLVGANNNENYEKLYQIVDKYMKPYGKLDLS